MSESESTNMLSEFETENLKEQLMKKDEELDQKEDELTDLLMKFQTLESELNEMREERLPKSQEESKSELDIENL